MQQSQLMADASRLPYVNGIQEGFSQETDTAVTFLLHLLKWGWEELNTASYMLVNGQPWMQGIQVLDKTRTPWLLGMPMRKFCSLEQNSLGLATPRSEHVTDNQQ